MTIPFGAIIPVRVLSASDALTTHRNAYWRIDLLDKHGAPAGTLDGVDGGSLDWTIGATIRGSGTLNVTDTGQGIDWLNTRIRPVYVLNGTTEWPRSVFTPSTPTEKWSGVGRSWQVALLDKSCVLDQDLVTATYALDVGTNVIATVRGLITGAGEDAGAITDSAAVLAAPIVWLMGTSKLSIINDLLSMAGYFALWVDMNGQFRAEPYAPPASRSSVYAFVDDANSIYGADFTHTADIYSVPNKVAHLSQSTGTTPALTSVATNMDPTSPYSYPSRGRWIVNADAATPVAATDQAALDLITRRDLINSTSVTAEVAFTHAPLAGIEINAVVSLTNTPAGINALHVVTKTHLDIEGGGALALATSTIRAVVNL